MDLASKIAVVTGASSGIGAAFSQALIQKGATVYGLARSTDKLNHLEQELGNSFKPVTLDITEHNTIDRWLRQTFGDDRQPDILINNAGLGRFGDVDDLPLEVDADDLPVPPRQGKDQVTTVASGGVVLDH